MVVPSQATLGGYQQPCMLANLPQSSKENFARSRNQLETIQRQILPVFELHRSKRNFVVTGNPLVHVNLEKTTLLKRPLQV